MTVSKYKVIKSIDLSTFEQRVRESLNEGYLLHGNLVVTRKETPRGKVTEYYREMVKYT